ncbi:MAG: putative lipid II flippase FtsW [Candidatus Omnitrophica bacterium]|nr:putative lipid II flippase FtsW [Candidatus Omnitrophota bacterium]
MKELRKSLAVVTMILLCIGIIMIYSSSGVFAMKELGDPMFFLKRHILFLMVGLILALGIMSMDYRDLQKLSKPLLVVTLVMLGLVLIPGIGKTSFGARRWFRIGPFNFQPAEMMKLTMLIYISDYLTRKKNKIGDFFQGFLPVIIVLGITCLLIVKQPDLGSAFLLGVIVMILIYIAGAKWQHIVSLGILMMPALYILVFRVSYRLKRIIAFIDPWQDSQGIGFQLSQSQIALGSGGIFGVGLGHSQQKLFYLPASHTDFILSIIGEELGLIGTMTVILLFTVFIIQGSRIAKRITDPFGYFLATGIVILVGVQAMVNIGVSIGALPTKGLPLPFISYGGSTLIFNMIFVGLLLNISRTEEL